ncbi:Pentatricopeptide repeat-containing protein [Cynara cardunculus var. scolymus]|uniref:Pentatricopeptide repeat-containing protein n=1 Tax=Cynara cardunculus var. scolymus TaxID=59895 RepID=A0A103Y879_CYNCS|nr:Pentatricopeptide repeat-containing protein [Cynara cardunculus var. scolymus]
MSYRKVANQIPLPVRNALISIQNCKLESNPPSFQPKYTAKLSTNLIKAYFDTGLLKQARQVFDEMPERDVVAWTAMISGYTACNRLNFAWMMFKDMMSDSLEHPNEFTFSSVLKACKGMKSFCHGALSHGLALRHGFVGSSIYVDNALLDMYATCCITMEHACLMFGEILVKNQVSWTTIMTGFTHRNDGLAALEVFRQMLMEDAEQCPYSFSIAVRACAGIGSLTYGQQIHASVFKQGFDLNIPVTNSVLDMYCKCNCFHEADECFNGMKERDSITWNTLIAGYEKFDPVKSLHMFLQMEFVGCTPDCFTYTSVIAACTNLSVLRCGQQIHGGIFKRGLEQDLPLANSLIDMYAKSGSIEDSSRIFCEMSCRDLFSWTSMMIGFGNHGYGKEAVELFNQMVNSGIRPDTIVFMALLTACSHAGLVDEGLSYFKLMTNEYKITPDQEIYACAIDLLGRGGRVKEAYDMILNMRFKPDESVWAAFLGACKAHGHPIMGKMTAQQVLDLRPRKAGIYVLLANMYTAEGKWGDRAKMRTLINELGNKKVAGRSWVEIKDHIYSFVAGDGGGSHLESTYQTEERDLAISYGANEVVQEGSGVM